MSMPGSGETHKQEPVQCTEEPTKTQELEQEKEQEQEHEQEQEEEEEDDQEQAPRATRRGVIDPANKIIKKMQVQARRVDTFTAQRTNNVA
jgi:hypothetical protein